MREKTNKELLNLYQEDRRTEIKQEPAPHYLYIMKTITVQTYNIYSGLMQVEDIINEGITAIMKGVDRFNLDRDNGFEAYITGHIRGMVINPIRKSDSTPRDYRKQNRVTENARMQPTDELGRQPPDEKIADHFSTEAKRYKRIQRISTMMNAPSLDMVTNEEHQSFQMTSEDIRAQPEQMFLREEALQTLIDTISNLGKKERMAISLYYVGELDITQIAGVLRVGEPKISQIHNTTVRRLKACMNKHLQQEGGIMYQGFCSLTSGMLIQNRNLNVIDSNMADVQAPGYGNDTIVANAFSEELLYRTGRHYKESAAPLATVSKTDTASRTYVDYDQGSFEQADGIYNFALDNKGFSCIRTQNGERYTRNGSLAVDGQDYFVLPGIGGVISTDNQPIQVDNEDFWADESGTISVSIITGRDDEDSEVGVERGAYEISKVVDFTDYEQLHKEDNGMIFAAQMLVQAAGGGEEAQISWKAPEKFNVNVVKETAAMMSSQRALQNAVQALKMYDQIMSRSVADTGGL